jgi:hypothetical protein
VSNSAKTGIPIKHGLCGRVSNRKSTDHTEALTKFMKELEQQGTPRATRLVRLLTKEGNTKTEPRDDDIELVELSRNTTQFGYYKKFVATKYGFKIKYDPKGCILNRVPIEGQEQVEKVPGWMSFRLFWKRKFSHVVIPNAGEDICDKRVVFANQIRYRQKQPGIEGLTEALLFDDDGGKVVPVDDLPLDLQDEMLATMKAKETKQLTSEQLILDAARYIEMEQKQREYFPSLKEQAVNNPLKPREEHKYVFVADYAQKVEVPSFTLQRSNQEKCTTTRL